jgi:UDP-sugar transporter A1/2/3
VGGLLVAVVVKYADNIMKGFAASFAVVLTFVISMYFSNFYPNQNFYIGAVSKLCII